MDILIDPYRHRAALLLTSQPYPYTDKDSMGLAADFSGGWAVTLLPAESLGLAADFKAGALTVTVSYASYITRGDAANLAGDFKAGSLTVTTTYANYRATELGINLAADFESGFLTVTTTYVTYSNGAPEGVNLSGQFVGGTLELA